MKANGEKRENKRCRQVERYYRWSGSVQSAQIKDQMSRGKMWRRPPELLRHTRQDRNIVVDSWQKCYSHSWSLVVKMICIYFECRGPLWKLNIYCTVTGLSQRETRWPLETDHSRVSARESPHLAVMYSTTCKHASQCLPVLISEMNASNLQKHGLCAGRQNTTTDK